MLSRLAVYPQERASCTTLDMPKHAGLFQSFFDSSFTPYLHSQLSQLLKKPSELTIPLLSNLLRETLLNFPAVMAIGTLCKQLKEAIEKLLKSMDPESDPLKNIFAIQIRIFLNFITLEINLTEESQESHLEKQLIALLKGYQLACMCHKESLFGQRPLKSLLTAILSGLKTSLATTRFVISFRRIVRNLDVVASQYQDILEELESHVGAKEVKDEVNHKQQEIQEKLKIKKLQNQPEKQKKQEKQMHTPLREVQKTEKLNLMNTASSATQERMVVTSEYPSSQKVYMSSQKVYMDSRRVYPGRTIFMGHPMKFQFKSNAPRKVRVIYYSSEDMI